MAADCGHSGLNPSQSEFETRTSTRATYSPSSSLQEKNAALSCFERNCLNTDITLITQADSIRKTKSQLGSTHHMAKTAGYYYKGNNRQPTFTNIQAQYKCITFMPIFRFKTPNLPLKLSACQEDELLRTLERRNS